jgi:FMN-dependent NADH-azoreductase
MSRVLIIESSARQQDSVSRQLTQTFISQWKAAHPNDQITVRDLAVKPVPHLDINLLGGWMKPAEQRSDIEQASLERSNQLTDELLAADVLVMAAPMYNFAIPSTLTFIHAEGMNLGGDFQEKGLNQANAKLSQVA